MFSILIKKCKLGTNVTLMYLSGHWGKYSDIMVVLHILMLQITKKPNLTNSSFSYPKGTAKVH